MTGVSTQGEWWEGVARVRKRESGRARVRMEWLGGSEHGRLMTRMLKETQERRSKSQPGKMMVEMEPRRESKGRPADKEKQERRRRPEDKEKQGKRRIVRKARN